jgi:hypothetical protein
VTGSLALLRSMEPCEEEVTCPSSHCLVYQVLETMKEAAVSMADSVVYLVPQIDWK